ncbi:MAG: hypothetical protein ABFC84_07075 [Veillonellales bacterium]
MINRVEVIKVLKSYWPEADYKTLNIMADNIITHVIPVIFEEVRQAISERKRGYCLRKDKNITIL